MQNLSNKFIWHKKDVNTELTKIAINKFNWQSTIFNKKVFNILNFTLHETIVCNEWQRWQGLIPK